MAIVAVIAVVFALAGGAIAGYALGRRRAGRLQPIAASSPPDPLPSRALEVLGHGVVVIDRDERAVVVNPSARAMGVLLGDRLAFADLTDLARAASDLGTAVDAEVDLPMGRLGREPIALSATAVPLPDDADPDRTMAVVLLLDDVTEQRRLEAVRRDFVANVSHELKTPVGALTLLAEAVLEAADDPEAVQRFAARMQHEGARLGRLVRELIELSRLQGAEPLPGDELVPLVRVIDEAADRTRLAAEQAGIVVRVSCPDELTVRGSETQLTMAIANLVNNAVAYSPSGTRVAVSAREATDGDDLPCVEIAVSDQGVGIGESDLNRVFERFYRVDQARSRATGGTGLGLAIVKHVATNHGGSVGVWSVEGAGSTFTIRLPLVHPAGRSSPRQSEPTMAKGSA